MAVARILVFAFALIHAVGLADLVMEDGCEEQCTTDDCGKDCLPGAACRCHCPSAMPALGAIAKAVSTVATPREASVLCDEQRMHASPDPREILHVPKHVA